MKLAYCDFEFNGISEVKLNLVSCAVLCRDGEDMTFKREFWLYEGAQRAAAKRFFENILNRGYTLVAYVYEAEARSLLSLGVDIEKCRAIDLYLEYRCLLNRNNELAYGEQYINGEVLVTAPPPNKWEKEDVEDTDLHHKPSYSLAAAVYKLLGVKIDTVEKTAIRDIIIEGNRDCIIQEKERIQRYNFTDIDLLPKLIKEIKKQFNKNGATSQEWLSGAYTRGGYALATAKMITAGYPVNIDKVNKFVNNISSILKSAAEQCLNFDDIPNAFRYNKKHNEFTTNEKAIRDWASKQALPNWRKTFGGKSGNKKLSISKDAFGDYFNSESEGFAGAFCRYLKIKQSLNGFLPGSIKKNNFFDFVGKDGRVRPYFGIYGAQSSRSQPGATGFIPLKAHWMRNFIEAGPGMAIAQADFSSEEFAVAAIISQDSEMMKAYESGDVYMAFGKAAGLIPKDGTKETHKVMRDLCKGLVLGISYDMSAGGLAPRLSRVMKKEITVESAGKLIDKFYEIYSDYAEFKRDNLEEYREIGRLELSDGWVMWGDNDNSRSVGNFPVQGESAVIMRECVKLAQSRGLKIIWTNHDSLAIEYPYLQINYILRLKETMLEAFLKVMGRFGVTIPVRVDCEAWSKYYKSEEKDGVKFMPEYLPQKGASDLERYRQFFN